MARDATVRTVLTANDQASGPIKNFQATLHGLKETTGGTNDAMAMLTGGIAGIAAAAAMDHTVAIKKSERRASEAIIQAGEHLIAMKDMLNHGQWRDWLGAEFAMSPDTAENMMNVARKFGNQENRNFRFLNTSVLYLLAKPSTPESAREEVIEEARINGPMPVKRAQEIITQYKPAAPAVFKSECPPCVGKGNEWQKTNYLPGLNS